MIRKYEEQKIYTKVKCSYGVPKFKLSRQKKFHICSCFVIVFSLIVNKFLAPGFEFGYVVTALYFTRLICYMKKKIWSFLTLKIDKESQILAQIVLILITFPLKLDNHIAIVAIVATYFK